MKNSKLLSIICFLCLCAIFSCEEDSELVPQQENAGEMLQLKMRLNASTEDFEGASEPSSRATSYVWQDEDVLYLNFFQNGDTLRGSAVYDSSSEEWIVSVPGNLERGAAGKVEVMFFKSLPLTEAEQVQLSSSIAVYQDIEGYYEYVMAGEHIDVEAKLKPLTSRIRFKGEVEDSISLGGVECYSSYDKKRGILLKDYRRIGCKVNHSGMTPYLYVLPSDKKNPQMTISRQKGDDIDQFTMDCVAPVLGVGKSGRMKLPTAASHEGWEMENIELFVDLGLSVKWASHNLGAYFPEEYGDFFAWGETQPKAEYSYDNCLTNDKPLQNISGNLQYDAATVGWGFPARIPTPDEFKELRDSTFHERIILNGKDGYLVTSKVNGKSIFFPLPGYMVDTEMHVDGLGAYWSGFEGEQSSCGTSVGCSQEFFDWIGDSFRWFGHCIRPVSATDKQSLDPIVITGDVEKFGINSVDVSVTFINVKGGATYGVEYSAEGQGNVSKKIMNVTEDGSYTVSLKYLEENTTYTYRAFVNWDGDIIYGENKKFTMKQCNSELWVDLGLSVKWASHNVGASAPEEYGDYFAWGEIQPKSEYTEENSLTYGKPMSDIVGNPQYDAATANWGAPARLPTNAEMQELENNTNLKRTTRNGINGCLLTSKKNGNSIFLPAAGYRSGTWLYFAGQDGRFWSSTPDENMDDCAYDLNFSSGYFHSGWDYRSCGLSVRPVRD